MFISFHLSYSFLPPLYLFLSILSFNLLTHGFFLFCLVSFGEGLVAYFGSVRFGFSFHSHIYISQKIFARLCHFLGSILSVSLSLSFRFLLPTFYISLSLSLCSIYTLHRRATPKKPQCNPATDAGTFSTKDICILFSSASFLIFATVPCCTPSTPWLCLFLYHPRRFLRFDPGLIIFL